MIIEKNVLLLKKLKNKITDGCIKNIKIIYNNPDKPSLTQSNPVKPTPV